jgi:hypothetical protein
MVCVEALLARFSGMRKLTLKYVTGTPCSVVMEDVAGAAEVSA